MRIKKGEPKGSQNFLKLSVLKVLQRLLLVAKDLLCVAILFESLHFSFSFNSSICQSFEFYNSRFFSGFFACKLKHSIKGFQQIRERR